MNRPPNDANSDNYVQNIPLFLVLVAAGLAGNYFNFPIFLNIDFLFGSIFAMLALQFIGASRAVFAAAIIASYTYFAWNHPYAIIIMTAEVATVGWLVSRRSFGLVLADTLYWLCVGMPLVYLFYHVVMHVPLSNTAIVMIKQAINGIANTLIARLIFSAYALQTRTALIHYRDIVCNLIAFFVLCPTLILLAVDSRTDFSETDQFIRSSLLQERDVAHLRLETWIANRQSTIVNLVQLAASRSPRQMQPFLELVKMDNNFLRVGLLDRNATTTAYSPLFDDLGTSNIGKNFADRSYVPIIRRSLKPMLTEVFMGRIGVPHPIVSIIAPVLRRGECNGFVTGTLSLEQIRKHLEQITASKNILYTLVDRNGNVVMSSRSDQRIMTPFMRSKGTFSQLDGKISRWVPEVPSNIPISERWKQSVYSAEAAIGSQEEWRLILERPVAPFQKALYDTYTGKLSLLFLVLLVSLALAEIVSRGITATLGQLSALSHELPSKVGLDGMQLMWPESGFYETHHLISSIRAMTQLVSKQFAEIRQINETLEQRIRERTAQIEEIMLEHGIILDNAPLGICKLVDRKLVWINPAVEALLLYSKEELDLQSTRMLYPSDEAYERLVQEAYPVIFQGLVFETIQELIRKDGVHVLVRYIGKALDSRNLSKGSIWVLEDITERKQAEEMLKKTKILLEQQVEERTASLSHALEQLSQENEERKKIELDLLNYQRKLEAMSIELSLAEERERDRIAGELHDQVGQRLIFGKMMLGALACHATTEKSLADFEELGNVIDLSIQDIRSLTFQLRPPLLASAGLEAALHWLGEEFREKYGLQLTFSDDGQQKPIRYETRSTLFQAARELMLNTVKHACASHVRIDILRDDTMLKLSVADDGIGFDIDEARMKKTATGGFGLVNLQRRIEHLGGSVRFESNPGKGTCVTIFVPGRW